MAMELGTLSGTREQYSDVKAREVGEEEGSDVQLLLTLPDGSQHAMAFKMGHTVACIKMEIERVHGVSMEQQRLTLAATGKQLLDILCLADYPQISSSAPNAVTVTAA